MSGANLTRRVNSFDPGGRTAVVTGVLETSLRGGFFVTQAFAPAMIERGQILLVDGGMTTGAARAADPKP